MPSRAATYDRNLAALERAENAAAAQVAAAYRQARAEIADSLIQRWPDGAQPSTPGQATQILRKLQLLEQIDARLNQLEAELGTIARGVVRSSTDHAITAIKREMALLPDDLRQPLGDMFGVINQRMVEQFIPVALNDMRLSTQSLGLTLKREIQAGIIQGQGFQPLVRRVLAATPQGQAPNVWPRGQTSAELAMRRLVITSENAAKQETIEQAAEQIPDVQKQLVATIGKDTTDTCLRAHGQIQPVDQPFELTGEPRFADRMMYPSFHWNCRSTVVMYHPSMERSGLTTAEMKKQAQDVRADNRADDKKQAAKKQAQAAGVRLVERIADAQTLAEAHAWAKANYPAITWEFDGSHIDTIRPTVEQFDKLAKDWPEVAKGITYVGTRQSSGANPYNWASTPNVMAHATQDGKTIGLNPAYYHDPVKFDRIMEHSEQTNWHPKGTNTPAGLLTHEFGHQVENWLLRQSKTYFTEVVSSGGLGLVNGTVIQFNDNNKPTKALSDYAVTTNNRPNKPEGWAEGIASIYYTPKKDWTAYTRRLDKLLTILKDTSKWTTAPDYSAIPSLRDLSGDARQRAIDELAKLRKDLNIP